MRAEADLAKCTAALSEPHVWFVHILEIVLAALAIITNCVLTVVTHNAVPVPYSQRRMLASISLNFVLLAGYQFARNLFLGVSMYKPCVNVVTTVTCKLYEFPLLFCYIHGAVAICIVAAQTTTVAKANHRTFRWTSTCSVWQTALAVVCMAITLVFAAFDHDIEPENMSQCSVLMALRDRDLTFCLLTMLIVLHAAASIIVAVSARRSQHWIATASHTTIALKDVITIEGTMWHCSLFFSGSFVLYRHIITNACDECIITALELSFVVLPLTIAFLHPMLSIWYVFPMRDAAVGAYPWLRFILPQYAMVPPPPVPTTQLGNKPATSAASKPPNANLEHKQSFVVSIPESNEKNSDAFKESDET